MTYDLIIDAGELAWASMRKTHKCEHIKGEGPIVPQAVVLLKSINRWPPT